MEEISFRKNDDVRYEAECFIKVECENKAPYIKRRFQPGQSG